MSTFKIIPLWGDRLKEILNCKYQPLAAVFWINKIQVCSINRLKRKTVHSPLRKKLKMRLMSKRFSLQKSLVW